MAAEKSSKPATTLRLAVRFLHFFEHVTESNDSLTVQFFKVGYISIGPGENRDAPAETFFSGWLTVADDIIGPGPGVCPDEPGDREAPEQYGDNQSD